LNSEREQVERFACALREARASGGLELDEKPPEQQNAQDDQNRDNDDLDQSHGRFLGIPETTRRKINRAKNVSILRALGANCQ
jgi:hypothetical protein